MNWRLNRSSLSAAMAVCGLFASLMAVAPSRLLADEADCNRSVTRYNAALTAPLPIPISRTTIKSVS